VAKTLAFLNASSGRLKPQRNFKLLHRQQPSAKHGLFTSRSVVLTGVSTIAKIMSDSREQVARVPHAAPGAAASLSLVHYTH